VKETDQERFDRGAAARGRFVAAGPLGNQPLPGGCRGGLAGNSDSAFDRSLELLDLTIADPRHRRRLRELTRLREALADYFAFDNRYSSTDAAWRQYFHAFTYAVAIRKGR
jgi:hypothetical protein